jgi:hypothetical protein
MSDGTELLEAAEQLATRLRPGDLDATLDNITSAAVELIPDAAFASITVRESDDSIRTVSASDDRLLTLDETQYTLREGPCYAAATDTPYLVSTSLGEDERFPKYGPAAVESGIDAQAAFRLFDRRRSQGALNLYATRPGAFADLDGIAALFRSQAAVAIGYAAEVAGVKTALETRTRIGQAIGVVMERYSLPEDRAFAFLTRLSQHRNVKLRVVAEEIVTAADPGTGGDPSPTGSAAG